MEHNVTVTIPNDIRYLNLAVGVIRDAAQLAEIGNDDIADIVTASRELLFNAIRHAYPKGMQGPIDVDIQLQPHGIRVSVHDMGLPFDFERYMASEREGGLKQIADYVDELRFSNLGKQGKSFTIFKSHPMDFENVVYRPYSDLEDESPASLKPASIQIRDFECGDEEAISRLIYNNYTYSYFKSLFYYPRKIRELNEEGEIASVVAQTREGEIVGHFALIRIPDANIAEIGVAVVHPDYKGKGIMNAMLDRVQQKAKELKLDAIFGEALMLHPFSQRANLRHGFGESALLLGIVPNTVSLTDPNAVRTDKRAAVLIGYKILNGVKERAIYLPSRYRELVEDIYVNAHLAVLPLEPDAAPPTGESRIGYDLSPYTQSGTLIVDRIGSDFTHAMRHTLHTLYKKHVDMIFADINLSACSHIDDAVEVLKEEGFVFSGVLFYRKGRDDYLRMQMPNSDNVETKEIVCHSGFCSELLQKINAELGEY
ncbi:GNAT family N-acetyltransferase [Hydrogenimonas sp. SS33]|uniref:GNAT family N-acetyltransferase n=1 Tax=Hydrogenimonas leucolamina TaxID=2954236 RepID=UPI00336BE0F1